MRQITVILHCNCTGNSRKRESTTRLCSIMKVSKYTGISYPFFAVKKLPDNVRDTENQINIPNYKCFHKHRVDRMGGGVSIFVKQDLRSRTRQDLMITTNLFKYTVVELKLNNYNTLLVSGY